MRANTRILQQANFVLSEKLRLANQDRKDLHDALQRSDTEMRAYKAGVFRLEEQVRELRAQLESALKQVPYED